MYSLEHKNYLKKLKHNNMFIHFIQIMIVLIFIIIWQILSNKGIINSFIFSSPLKVIKTIYTFHKSGDLYHHIFVTVYETLISFILSTFLGVFIACLLWLSKNLAKITDPYITVLNSLPKVALGPIIIIWGGASIKSIIIMALLITLFISISNSYQAFISTDINKINLMKSFNSSKSQIFFKLILPDNFSSIISNLKINISMSLVGVIMGEFLVSKSGIGYLIMYGSQVFNLNLVISGIILLGVIAFIMYYLVLLLEKKLTKS